jgi:hypothetical protein
MKVHGHDSRPRGDYSPAEGLAALASFPRRRTFRLWARDVQAGLSRAEAVKLVSAGAAWVCVEAGELSLHPLNDTGLWDDDLGAAFDKVVRETTYEKA